MITKFLEKLWFLKYQKNFQRTVTEIFQIPKFQEKCMLRQPIMIGLLRSGCLSMDDSWPRAKEIIIQLSLLMVLSTFTIPLWASQTPLKGVSQIELGSFYSCALMNNGKVKCWGGGTTGSQIAKNVIGLEGQVKSIAGGSYHTCALLEMGNIKCWGSNSLGQLGNGTKNNSVTPVDVVDLGKSWAVVAGDYHSCALLETGKVKCWGSNSSGQLGNRTLLHSNIPVEVIELGHEVVAISGGNAHTCASLGSGSIKCWGSNYSGQLGNGTMNNSSIPVDVGGLNNSVMVAAGDYHTCALLETGQAKCWGGNNTGQLGNGTMKNSNLPSEVTDLSDIIFIAGGGSHTCALSKAGTSKCWGYNKYGQLANGTKESSLTPIEVTGLEDSIISIDTGDFHTCAVLEKGGKVKCWGYNAYGQVGNNSTVDSFNPVDVLCEDCLSSNEGNVYCVNDQGLNDSQLCVGTLFPTPSFTFLGPLYKDCDLESLDASPLTGDIFAAAGDDTPRPSHLYYVSKEDGNIVDLGDIGGRGFLQEIDALSFHPKTNELWGWAQKEGLFVIQHLPSLSSPMPIFPEVNMNHPQCKKPSRPPMCGDSPTSQCGKGSESVPIIEAHLVLPVEGVEVEDISWNWRGDTLYAVENLHHGDPDKGASKDSKEGIQLWAYNGKDVVVVCPNITSLLETHLGQHVEIEGMESLSPELFPGVNPVQEDVFLISFHNVNKMNFIGITVPSVPLNPDAKCILWEWADGAAMPFSDIEGITYFE